MTSRKHRRSRAQAIGFACASASFAMLLGIARYAPSAFAPLDGIVSALLIPFQTYGVIAFFSLLTTLGGAPGIVMVAGMVLVFLYRQPRHALELITLLAGVGLSVNAVKVFVARPRPELLPWLDPLQTYSFPSAHAASIVALYGFIAYLLHKEKPRWGTAGIVACVATILLVALSRPLLNAHFASDVLGGIALALAWLFAVRLVSDSSR